MPGLYYTMALWFLIVSYNSNHTGHIVFAIFAIAYLIFASIVEHGDKKVRENA